MGWNYFWGRIFVYLEYLYSRFLLRELMYWIVHVLHFLLTFQLIWIYANSLVNRTFGVLVISSAPKDDLNRTTKWTGKSIEGWLIYLCTCISHYSDLMSKLCWLLEIQILGVLLTVCLFKSEVVGYFAHTRNKFFGVVGFHQKSKI